VVIEEAQIRPQPGRSHAAQAQDTVAIRCGDDWQSQVRATHPLAAAVSADRRSSAAPSSPWPPVVSHYHRGTAISPG